MTRNNFPQFSLEVFPVKNRRVGRVVLLMPFTYEEARKELENEVWISPAQTNNLGQDLWEAQRCHVMSPKREHTCLTQLVEYFRSDELKWEMIKHLYDLSPGLRTDWDWTPEDMFHGCQLHGHFSRDVPGFVNVLHTDYRKLVATGMFYWNDADDEDVSTWFYDSRDRVNPTRMPTGFGAGWIHANGNDTYHEGWNRTDRYRYSTLLGLTLNVQTLNDSGFTDPNPSLINS